MLSSACRAILKSVINNPKLVSVFGFVGFRIWSELDERQFIESDQ